METKEMSGEEWLLEDREKRVGMSESWVIQGRRSEGMTQSNTSFPRGPEVPLEFQRSDSS